MPEAWVDQVRAPLPTERCVQRSILAMAGRCFPEVILHASPNGGHLAGDSVARFKQVGALRGDGMKVGWPDLICLWNHGVAFIEVKRPKVGKVSEVQERMHHDLAERGFPVAVVISVEEAFQHLRDRGAPWNGLKPLEMMVAA